MKLILSSINREHGDVVAPILCVIGLKGGLVRIAVYLVA